MTRGTVLTEMEGFYTKEETATILGVSTRQVNHLMKDKTLRRVYNGNKAWIPHEDVDLLYRSRLKSRTPSREEFENLKASLERLERETSVLKVVLGHGAPKTRGVTELLLLKQRCMDGLARISWSSNQMAKASDDIASLTEEELTILEQKTGDLCWAPFLDLLKRMLVFVETSPDYPGEGLDTLHAMLMRARNKLYGIIHVTTRLKVTPKAPSKALKALAEDPSYVDRHIAAYITARA